MASDVIVPEVGELGMDVTFVRWLKAEGDEVAVGDPLFEVDTDKSVMVVEAYAAGTLTGLRASEGDIVAPRDVIGTIVVAGERAVEATGPTTKPEPVPPPPPASGSFGAVESSSAAPATGSSSAEPDSPAAGPGSSSGGVSPRARRVARELGLDPASLAGSGPQGMVTEADVRAAAVGRADGGAVRPDPGERARRAIADLTVASWRSIPHFYLQLEADVEAGMELAKPTPLICAATAQALVRHPECNLGWEGDRPVRRSSVDLGLLVDTSHGLLITVVNDAQDLAMPDMAEAIGHAVERARSGRLAAADMGPRSLTVSNLGMHAVDRFAAVIPTPDVMTLAVGRTRVAPRWDDTVFTPRRVIGLTLSVDHRALDGAAAARFLTALEAILADPVAEGLV